MSEVSVDAATACVDPDRIVLEQFQNEGDPATTKKIEIISVDEQDPERCATFCIRQEDHTLGNLLRHFVMRDPSVEFCGYSLPHPSESKIHIRIQCNPNSESTAVDVLHKALDEIILSTQQTQSTFQQRLSEFKE